MLDVLPMCILNSFKVMAGTKVERKTTRGQSAQGM